MLKIIEGGFRGGSKKRLTELIKESVNEGKRSVLIVPEQQTLSEEKDMSLTLSPGAALVFEVTNFTRFTNTVFRRIGGVSGEYCTKAERSLLMWRALSKLGTTLSLTGHKKEVAPGTVARAMSAVKEMESLGLTPEKIAEVAYTYGATGRLKEKLMDLSAIWSEYSTLLTERYADAVAETKKLSQMLREGQDPQLDEIFIDGFTSFTEPQYELLGELMRKLPVTVTLTMPTVGKGGFEWAEVKGCERRLLALSTKVDTKKYIEKVESAEDDDRLLLSLASALWRKGEPFDNSYLHDSNNVGERVRIFEAATPFDECDFVAADIRRRVMDGARFSDFAIIARCAESYMGILDSSLRKAGVPHFISIGRDLSAFEAVKLIYSAYAIASRGFRREDVLSYLKTGLTGIGHRERDELEGYVNTWRIDGARFYDGVGWNMNPRGYAELNEHDKRILVRLNETREKLITPLISLKDDCSAAKTVKDHATALVRFLIDVKLESRLVGRAIKLKEAGEDAAAEENARLWGIICRALDTLVELVGDVEANSDSFTNQLAVLINEETVGKIPAHIDEVTVGSADMLRTSGKRQVYLLGVNRGECPGTVSDSSYFTDRDKRALCRLGLEIEENLDVKCARELYCFSRAFTLAKDGVTLLYTSFNAQGAPAYPSDVIGRLVELLPRDFKIKKISELSLVERIFSPSLATEIMGELSEEERIGVKRALERCGCAHRVSLFEEPIDNPRFKLSGEVARLIFDGDLSLSQSSIEKFLGCPMGYFFSYTLHLKEEEVAEITSGEVGSFIHGILEDIFRSCAEKNIDLCALSSEEIRELCCLAAERYTSHILEGAAGKARTRVMISRVTEAAVPVLSGLIDELRGSRYRPVCFEVSTDRDNPALPDPVIYDGEEGRIIITGKVDRIDTYVSEGKVYVRVMDYKTGSKSFLPSDLEKGYNLQMFIYLKAVVETEATEFRERIGAGEGDELVPAGAIYIKTSLQSAKLKEFSDSKAEEAVKSNQTRDGMVLDEEESLGAMHPSFIPKEPSGRGKDNETRRYDREGWTKINDTMELVVRRVAGGIRSGDIEASPSHEHNPCNYCGFKNICRRAKQNR